MCSRCVLQMGEMLHIFSPYQWLKTTQQKRLVIDLRYLNQHLLKEKFKYEDLRLAMHILKKIISCFHLILSQVIITSSLTVVSRTVSRKAKEKAASGAPTDSRLTCVSILQAHKL